MSKSQVFTTEEYFDNLLYGQDGFLPLVSVAVPFAIEGGGGIDQAIITAVAAVSASVTTQFVTETATVTAVAVPSAVIPATVNVDSNTVSAAAVISAPDVASYRDSATETAQASLPTADVRASVDSDMVTAFSVIVSLEGTVLTDNASVQSTTNISSVDNAAQVAAATATGVAIISTSDVASFTDTTVATSAAVIIFQEQTNSGNNYSDQNTVTAVSVASALDGKLFFDAATTTAVAALTTSDGIIYSDAATVTEFQAIAATDTRQYNPDVSTATSAAAISDTDTMQTVDAATITSIATIISNEGVPTTDADTITAAAASSSVETFTGNAIIETYTKSPVSSGWGTASVRGGSWTIMNGTASDFSTNGTFGNITFATTAGHEIGINVPAPPTSSPVGASELNVGQLMQWQWNANNAGTSSPITLGALLVWADLVNRYYYRLVVSQPVSSHSLRLALDKITPSGLVSSLVAPTTVISTGAINTYYNLRVEGTGLAGGTPTITGNLWLASGTEPTTPQLTYTDSSGVLPPQNANYGVRATNLSGNTSTITLKFSSYSAYYL